MPTVMEEEDATGVVEVAEGLEVVAECIMGTYDVNRGKRRDCDGGSPALTLLFSRHPAQEVD